MNKLTLFVVFAALLCYTAFASTGCIQQCGAMYSNRPHQNANCLKHCRDNTSTWSDSDLKIGKLLGKIGKGALKIGKVYANAHGIPLADTESDLKIGKLLGKVGKGALKVGKIYANAHGIPLADSEKINFERVKGLIGKARSIRDLLRKKKTLPVEPKASETESDLKIGKLLGKIGKGALKIGKVYANAHGIPLADSESDLKIGKVLGKIGKGALKVGKIYANAHGIPLADSAASQTGGASYYADYFNGRQTANGERFSNSASTCAHRTLPFGTRVTIRNLSNGRTATCRVNDRGPYASGRVIDLTKAVFQQLGSISAGVLNVQISW